MKMNVGGKVEEVSMFYVLDENGEPQVTDDLKVWAFEWGFIDNRRVARDELVATFPPEHRNEEIVVSTVFLGIDHNFHDFGEPVLYETCVFGGPMNGEIERYSSREEAVRGHALMVENVKRIGAVGLDEWLDPMDEEEDAAE